MIYAEPLTNRHCYWSRRASLKSARSHTYRDIAGARASRKKKGIRKKDTTRVCDGSFTCRDRRNEKGARVLLEDGKQLRSSNEGRVLPEEEKKEREE